MATTPTTLDEIMTDTNRPTDVDEALAAAEDALTLDIPDEHLLAPHGAFEDETLTRDVAGMVSPWYQIIRAVIDQPAAEDVDGVAPGHLDPEPAQSVVFEAAFETAEDEDDGLTFEIVDVFENSYGTQKVVVETPAPWDTPDDMTPPNDLIKSLPWDDDEAADHDVAEKGVHYTFGDDDPDAPPAADQAWTLDAHGVDALRTTVESNGYEWVDSRDDGEANADAEADDQDGLDRLIGLVEEGDRVTVRYRKKNGSGIGTKTGDVSYISAGKEGRTQGVGIERDDGNFNNIKRDDNVTPGIFSHSQYPFMGSVVSVEVVPTDEDENDETAE